MDSLQKYSSDKNSNINNNDFSKNNNTNKTNKPNKAHTNIIHKKYIINTYKTLSEISTMQNDNKKNNTILNIPSNIISNDNDIYENNINNYLIIEETSNTYRDNQKYKNKNYKENGIFNGDILFFDPNGLKYGLRGKKDGYAFFGSFTHYHGKIINDYILNINFGEKIKNSSLSLSSNTNNDENNNNNNIPIVYFAIYYEKQSKKFFLKNLRKINYNKIETFIFSFAIFQRYLSDIIIIKENIIICFNENHNYVLCMLPMNNDILKVYLIKLDRVDNNNNYYKSVIIYKSCFENNGVSKIIGIKGNIKIDLQGKNYILKYNKYEKYWQIKSSLKTDEIFWIMIERKTELTKENIFKINSKFFKITYN